MNLSHSNLFHHQIDSVLAILPQAQYHPLHVYAKFFRNQSILKAFNNLNSNRCLRLDFKNHDQNPMKLLKAANVHFSIFTRPSSVALVNLMTNYSIRVELVGHPAQHTSQFWFMVHAHWIMLFIEKLTCSCELEAFIIKIWIEYLHQINLSCIFAVSMGPAWCQSKVKY